MRVPVINIVVLLNPWCAPPYFSFLQNALFLLVLSMHYRI